MSTPSVELSGESKPKIIEFDYLYDPDAGNTSLTWGQRMARVEIGEIQREYYEKNPVRPLPAGCADIVGPKISDELRKAAGLPLNGSVLSQQAIIRHSKLPVEKMHIPGMNLDNLSSASTVSDSDCKIHKSHVVGHAAVECISEAIKSLPKLHDPRAGCVHGAVEGAALAYALEFAKQRECEAKFKKENNTDAMKERDENNMMNRINAQINYKPSEIRPVNSTPPQPGPSPSPAPFIFSSSTLSTPSTPLPSAPRASEAPASPQAAASPAQPSVSSIPNVASGSFSTLPASLRPAPAKTPAGGTGFEKGPNVSAFYSTNQAAISQGKKPPFEYNVAGSVLYNAYFDELRRVMALDAALKNAQDAASASAGGTFVPSFTASTSSANASASNAAPSVSSATHATQGAGAASGGAAASSSLGISAAAASAAVFSFTQPEVVRPVQPVIPMPAPAPQPPRPQGNPYLQNARMSGNSARRTGRAVGIYRF